MTFNDIINSFDETAKKDEENVNLEKQAKEQEAKVEDDKNNEEIEVLLKKASADLTKEAGVDYVADVLTENELIKIAGLGDAITNIDEDNMEIAIEKVASDFANLFIEKVAQPMGAMEPGMDVQHPAVENAENAESIVAEAVSNGLPRDQIFDLIDAAREQGTKEGIRVMQQLMQQQMMQEQMAQEQMMQEQMMQEQMAQAQGAQQPAAPAEGQPAQ